MNIYVIGVNYKYTPIEIREKLNFSSEETEAALKELKDRAGRDECALISTCNRTEVYIFSQTGNPKAGEIEELICRMKGLKLYDIKKYFYFYGGQNAVRHVFKVASGLDSMLLGEDHILGQFKAAHAIALKTGASSAVLNTLFKYAVTASKSAKSSTGRGKNITVSKRSVILLKDIFGKELDQKTALVIGAGKIGSLVMYDLCRAGIKKLYIAGRNHHRVEALQRDFPNAKFMEYNQRYSVIPECEIVISATSSPHYTITADVLEKAPGRDYNGKVFIDLALPRDLDAAIGGIPGIRYYNLDDLGADSGSEASQMLEEEESIVEEHAAKFEKWYWFREAMPAVREVKKYTDVLLNEKLNDAVAKLETLDEDGKEVIRVAMTSTINSIFDRMIYGVRDCASKEEMEVYFKCVMSAMKGR